MSNVKRLLKVSMPAALALAALIFVGQRAIIAADHLDAPARTDIRFDPTPDVAADIADVFTFHDATNFVVIVTFAGPRGADLPAVYDPDVLYRINLSNAGSRADTEIPIEVRFGFDGPNPGVEVRGLPGAPVVQGPVETNISANGYLIRAGLFDEPFFFDLQGFRDTLSTGTLMMRPDRDFFAGQNDTAIVIQIPRSRIENGTNPIDVWAETGRIGGQL